MHSVNVPIQLDHEEIEPPIYATQGAAGADVRANLSEEMILEPSATALVPTGIRLQIPIGYEIQIRPRSGFAFKHQITVLNAPGTIDSDYRGELKIILINHGKEPFVISHNMRIAQMILAPVYQANFIVQKSELSSTHRGESGFGHTGSN